ncbi:DUF6270 domain-containing protein [Paenarthrobacter sp. NPDC056912]|uniref:DUF6270 domain-containing protein n=1 Tax=Paenarthrobacter sp. NPDC056912 TaxID=3345965 RepID=UPI00367128F5
MARIFVYGSCVSRDSFEFLDKSEHELIGYTARQSLISATGSPYPASANAGTLESRFQIRNLQNDFDGTIFRTLADVASSADFIFWDLTDERLGVIKVGHDSYITRSVELLQSGLIDNIGDPEWIKFGSNEHFELWRNSVVNFADFVRAHSIESKIVLFNLPWSMHDDFGAPIQKSWGMFPDEANNLLAKYMGVLREHLNLATIELPWEMAVSSRDHKWRLAPYHYHDDVYQAVVNQFNSLEAGLDEQKHFASGAGPEPKSLDDRDWHDAVLEPQTFLVPSGAKTFGIQFEAISSVSPGNKILLSLKLEGAEGLPLVKNRITKSGMESVGHFRYVEIDSARRKYYAGFELPDDVSCTSVTIMGWQIAQGQIQIRDASLFAGNNLKATNTASAAEI